MTPYVGELRIFGGNFAPVGWAFCEGQLLPISENETLFQLIGTSFGGDGQSTFALPDLRGRLPLHQGNSFILAEPGGAEHITLTVAQIPSHSHHILGAVSSATTNNPANMLPATAPSNLYGDMVTIRGNPSSVPLPTDSLNSTGGSQPHTNFMPYLCVNFIISLYGIFPSPT